METTKVKRAVGYCRVSTGDQKASIGLQPDRIRQYCSYNNIELVDIIIDEDVSGFTPIEERSGGKRVLGMIDRGEVNCVVTLKLDRLFRNVVDCLTTTQDWDKGGVSLHIVDMSGMAVDSSSAVGKMFLTMMAGFAEMERSLISERTKAALKHKKSNGECVGKVSYGYRCVDGKLVVDDAQMSVVRKMFEMKGDGVSLNEIARRCTVVSGGHRFYPGTVKNILGNSIHENISN